MKENFFSPIAKDYARFRPAYPTELFEYLASMAPGRRLAWDCATGSGQAAQSLALHFEHVEATDISEELLAEAIPHARVRYRKADALSSGLPGHSVDLITVANAMHWFHGEAFASEVRRVLVPGGLIAAWGYAFSSITPAVDKLTRRVHNEIVDPFWIAPNRVVEDGYKDLYFPFIEIPPPTFSMVSHLNLHELEGYMRTWSASQKYLKQHGTDPIGLVHKELEAAWGEPALVRPVNWKLNVRIGRA